MKTKYTLTDKLLAGALAASVASTLLHTTVPSVICTVIHVAVLILTACIHLQQVKSESAQKPIPKTNNISD